jgi:hypothetical protein
MRSTGVRTALLVAALFGHGCARAAHTRVVGHTRRVPDGGGDVAALSAGGDAASTSDRDAGEDGAVSIATAGDIACSGCAQNDTADLLDGLLRGAGLAAVLPLGDDAYVSGSLAEFERFYRPAWGRPELLAITHPVPGNHEYADGTAAGYFDFFDGAGNADGSAGARGQGYYSWNLAGWHLIALNSSDECRWVSCAAGSPQHQWLVADLAAHPAQCTLAFWHHPRFQAGNVSGEATAVAPLWDALYDAGADVVLNGHEHGYQQLAPLDKVGAIDPDRGIRTFVVGTGGGDYDTTFGGPRMGALEASLVSTHGVLELTLRPGGYDWKFFAVGGGVPPEASGTALCH